MPVLINKETGLAEDLPQEQADYGLGQGTHEVPLLDPQGNTGSASPKDAQNLLNQGYSQPDPTALGSMLKYAKHGTPLEKAKTVAEGAADLLTLGTAPAIERGLLGVPAADIRARREINEPYHMTGQALPLLIPGIGEALGAAGEGVAGLLGLSGAESAAGRIAAATAKNAAETAMVSGTDEVSKMFSQDPHQTLETAMSNIGLNGLLGGAIGGVGFGAVPEAWRALGETPVGKILSAIKDKKNGIPRSTFPSEALDASAERAGIELSPAARSFLSDNPEMRSNYQQLMQSTTRAGKETAEETAGLYRQGNEAAMQAMGTSPEAMEELSNLSPYDIGIKTKEAVKSAIKSRLDPLAKKFEEIAAQFKGEALTGADLDPIADQVGKLSEEMGGGLLEGSPKGNIFNRVLTSIPKLKNLEELRNFQTQIANATDSPELWGIRGGLKKIFRNAEERIVTDRLSVANPELAEVHQVARQQYGALRRTIDDLNDRLHVGRYDGPSSFIRALDDMKPEQVLSRLSPRNDAGLFQILSKEAPEAASIVKQNFANQALKTAGKNPAQGEAINFKALSDQVKSWSPELRQFALPEGAEEKLGAVKEVLDAIPKNMNPPGTAKTLDALWSGLSGSGMAMVAALMHGNPVMGFALGALGKYIARDAKDAMKLATLKFIGSDAPVNAGAFKVLAELISHTYKGEALISNAAKSLFKAGATVLPQAQEPSAADLEKLRKRVSHYQIETADLLDVGGHTGHYAPEVGAAMGELSARAVNYLSSLKPSTDRLGPLDPKREPSQMAKAKYDRALTVAEQPLMALKFAKNGTLTSSDVTTLQTIYPALYQRLQNKLTSEMINHTSKGNSVPYQTRLGLSRLLGQPLDSTMTSNAIMAAQPKMQTTQNNSGPSKVSQKASNGLMKLSSLASTPGQAQEAKQAKEALA